MHRLQKHKITPGWIAAIVLLLLVLSCMSDLFWSVANDTGQMLGLLPADTPTASSTPRQHSTPTTTRQVSSPHQRFPTLTREPTFEGAVSSRNSMSSRQRMTVTAVMALELTAMAERFTPTPTLPPPTEPPPTPPPTPTVPPLAPATAPPLAPATAPPLAPATAPPLVPATAPVAVIASTPTAAVPTVPPYIPAANPALPLPAPSLNDCQPDPASSAVPNYPVRIYTVNKETEVFTLENVSPESVSLNGWVMCSIQGGEKFDRMNVTLAPGETRRFVYPGAAIWNNDQLDDGALYNAQGQLVSYWSDPNW